MEERVYLDDGGRIRRYFYPSECQVFRQTRALNLPWREELYVTKRGRFVVHTYSDDGALNKWEEIEEQEARFWLARNGIDAEVEI